MERRRFRWPRDWNSLYLLTSPLPPLQLQILGMFLPFARWSWVIRNSVCGRRAVSMCSFSAAFLPTPIPPDPQLSLVPALRTAPMGLQTQLSCTVFRTHPDICSPHTRTHSSTSARQCRCASLPVAPAPHSHLRWPGPSPHLPVSAGAEPGGWWDHATRRLSGGSEYHSSCPGIATRL